MGDRKTKPVICICGLKNSGKTTLIERVLPLLADKGLRVAVIKHDGHDFTCDVQGTDSARVTAAGAYGTGVFSAARMFVTKQGYSNKLDEMVSFFPEADIILIEGMKDLPLKKIEIVRKGIAEQPVSNPEGRLLVVTDLDHAAFQEETCGIDDLAKVVEVIEHVRMQGA